MSAMLPPVPMPDLSALLRADREDRASDRAAAEAAMEGAHWGTVEVAGRARPEAGLLRRATYFGEVFLCVDVPNVDVGQKLAPGEPLLKLCEGQGMTRRLFPMGRVECITVTDEVEARTEAVHLVFAAEEALAGYVAQSEPPARARRRWRSIDSFGGQVDLVRGAPLETELGRAHGSEVCPSGQEHRWVRVLSTPKADGDASPDHPAERKNLAVWFECAFCQTWCEVAEGGEGSW